MEEHELELENLKREIFELEHQPGKAGRFEPRLIPLYRRLQELQKNEPIKEENTG